MKGLYKFLKRWYTRRKDKEMKRDALDIAKWFMDNRLDEPRNDLRGNIKLQKLLFFAQLINLALYNRPLINGSFYAFDHGMVMQDVRLAYKDDHKNILKREPIEFSSDEQNTLNLTKEIYGDASAEELEDMSHQFDCWRKHYTATPKGFKRNKDYAIVPEKDLIEELDTIKDVLHAHEIIKNGNGGDAVGY